MNKSMSDYMINPNYSTNDGKSTMFDLGGCSKVYSGVMSHNNIDIESKLRNIRSANLEGMISTQHFNESPYILLNYLTIIYAIKVYLPNAFLHHSNERPGFHNL